MMSLILNLPIQQYIENNNIEKLVDDIYKDMWLYVSSYEVENTKVYYIQDQVGCGFIPAYPNLPNDIFSSSSNNLEQKQSYIVPFESSIYQSKDGNYYTVVWPTRDIEEGEPLVCISMNSNLISRLALLKVVDCEPFISLEDYEDILPENVDNKNDNEEENKNDNRDEENEEDEEDEDIIDPHHLSFPTGLNVENIKNSIQQLAQLFQISNYTVENINKILSLSGFDVCLPTWELSSLNYRDLFYNRLKSYLHDKSIILNNDVLLKEQQTCGIISLFCLGITLPLSEIILFLGSNLTLNLIKLGILLYEDKTSSSNSDIFSIISTNLTINNSGLIHSIVQITPVYHINTKTTLYFMTDYSHQSSLSNPIDTSPLTYETYFDPIMYIGPDSLALFQSLSISSITSKESSTNLINGLDVFCGCGIQGVTTLKINLVNNLTFLERNHRAIRFLRFNLLLNSINMERVKIIHDDVHNIHNHLTFNDKFNIILANPPYIPTGLKQQEQEVQKEQSIEEINRGLLAYGAGGSDGEEFISFVYQDISRYLTISLDNSPSFIFLVSNLVNIELYSEKIINWIQNQENQELVSKVNIKGYIIYDKPWNNLEYAQLILNRNTLANSVEENTRKQLNVERYANDLSLLGVKNVCNGIIFLKLQSNHSTNSVERVINKEQCSEQIWQLLNLPETSKEKNQEYLKKIHNFIFNEE